MRNRKHRDNSKRGVMVILTAAVLIAAVLCITLSSSCTADKAKEFHLSGGSRVYFVNDEEHELSHEPFAARGNVYIPAEDILSQCGYAVEKNTADNSLRISKEDSNAVLYADSDVMEHNGKELRFDASVLLYDDVLFIPLVMYKQLSDNVLTVDGSIDIVKIPIRDNMEDTYIDDTYRSSGAAVNYNGVYVVDNKMGMEMLTLSEDNCVKYAEVINSIADLLPDVNVYNIVVPSMTEFYGPEKVYTDQLSGIRTIYSNLNENVMPINAAKELWAHADEHIYFGTDHHWTQRGAYYAYKAFMENREEEVPALESFETDNVEGFVGSWVNYVKGTAAESVMRSNSETLERFLPMVEYSGAIYSDMYMNETILSDTSAINLNSTSYVCFIHGDYPVTKYTTNVKNGKKVVLIKESYGNAFATWLLNDFEEVYVIDPRHLNGKDGQNYNEFKLGTFYDEVCQFTDLIVIDYPGGASPNMRNSIAALVQ